MNARLLIIVGSFVFLLSRGWGITTLPLFSDEAYAIIQAERLRHGASLLGMVKNTTQPVFIWLIAIFQFLPVSVITSSRMASETAGLFTASILAVVSSRLINPRSWPIAFVIALVLPFSFFYDRTVLFESTAGSAIALSLFFPVIGVPLAILVKQTGWLALPLVILTNRKIKSWFLTLLTAVLIPLIVWAVAYGSLAGLQNVLSKTSSAPISARADIKSNLLRSKIWLRTYLTDPIIAIAMIGALIEIGVSVKKRTLTPLLGVALWTVGVVLFESAIARIFYPRYLYPVIIGVVLLATRGVWTLLHELKRMLPLVLLVPVVLLVPLLPSLHFDWLLMTNPSVAPLALEDRFQFFEDWTSGVGSKELADAIRTYHRDIPGKLTVYLEEENSYAVTLLEDLKGQDIQIEIAGWLVDPLREIPDEVRAKAPHVLFVRNRNPDIPPDWPVEKIFSFAKTPVREASLYRIL